MIILLLESSMDNNVQPDRRFVLFLQVSQSHYYSHLVISRRQNLTNIFLCCSFRGRWSLRPLICLLFYLFAADRRRVLFDASALYRIRNHHHQGLTSRVGDSEADSWNDSPRRSAEVRPQGAFLPAPRIQTPLCF